MALLEDVRYAVRTMRKTPAFTAVAVAALALGIGANSGIFTLVNAVLLRPLPYKDPDRLVVLARSFPQGLGTSISVPKYFTWKRGSSDFLEHVAIYDFLGPGLSLGTAHLPEQVRALHVSADYFPLFGVVPARGRTFTAEEDRPGGPHVVVISYGLWTRRFGGDPSLIGRRVLLSGEPHTVVGVAPASFEPDVKADIWMPIQADPNTTNQGHYLLCAARLKPGITLSAANARMRAAGEQFRRQYPEAMGKDESAAVRPMRDLMVGRIRPLLLVLLGAVAFVLLMACANVANLLLARAAAREKEIAIRTAMGASRARLIRQLLTESGLLALGGGVCGVVIGYWAVKLLVTFTPAEIPRVADLAARSGLDLRVLGFTLLVSLATGVLFGLAPAWQASHADLHSALKEASARSTTGVRHLRARSLLVIAEMALGLVLLTGAGLLIRSAMSLRSVQPGIDARNVVTFKTALSGTRYANTAAVTRFSRQLTERLENLPGVQAAANTITLPITGGPDLGFTIEGRKGAKAEGDEFWRYVSPHFFAAFRIQLLRGRVFSERDTAGAPPVAIINEAFARKYFPKQEALGQQLTVGKGGSEVFADATREIVGVVGNLRDRGLNNDPPPILYVPQAQVRDGLTALGNSVLPVSWAVRTVAQPAGLAETIRREVSAVDPHQAAFGFQPMTEVIDQTIADRRFFLMLLSIFAGMALLLAAIGIYGVMAYTVQQRTNEIGIRIALGADAAGVVALVLRHALVLAGIGVAIGLGVAFGVTRVLAALLYGVNATDPVTFGVVAGALSVVAMLASLIPARRAARVDPVIALRYQ